MGPAHAHRNVAADFDRPVKVAGAFRRDDKNLVEEKELPEQQADTSTRL